MRKWVFFSLWAIALAPIVGFLVLFALYDPILFVSCAVAGAWVGLLSWLMTQGGA
jgi:hypothetical protein